MPKPALHFMLEWSVPSSHWRHPAELDEGHDLEPLDVGVALERRPSIEPAEQLDCASLSVPTFLGSGTKQRFAWHRPSRMRLTKATTDERRLPDQISLAMPASAVLLTRDHAQF
jgi:hypothetical protein